MREKNRKPIASYIKLPQFTTMNVIDGQAGLIIYASLIFYSLTIDNILNIIVLLILAGVTIATLTGNNGLLQKATDAKQANEEASSLEKIKVEVAGSYGLDGKIDKEQLIKNLKSVQGLTYKNSTINENTIIDSFPATVKLNGYSFTISENGTVENVAWIDNYNGSYTNAETGQTLTVGDTVKYETILNTNAVDSTKLSQLKFDLQTYSGDSSSTDNANIARDNLTWKFLDIKNGQIRLISTVPTSSTIKLENANGYNNAVYLIDKACDTLYSVSGTGKAQNVKIEDIEEKINTSQFDYKQYENSNVDTGKYGGVKEYTSNLQYPKIYVSEEGCKAIGTTNNTNNTLGLSSQTIPITGSNTASTRLKATHTYWEKSMDVLDFTNSEYYNLFINGMTYWLSSRSIYCGSNRVYYGVRFVHVGRILKYEYLFTSNGETVGVKNPFHPVVTLEQGVQLEPDGTNTWKIK